MAGVFGNQLAMANIDPMDGFSWMNDNRRNCHGLGFDVMNPKSKATGRPVKGQPKKPNLDDKQREVAETVCHGKGGRGPCPFMDACLDYAQRTCSYKGVWGGKTEKERAELRKKKVA